MMQLREKHVLVTGASRGIGAELVAQLAARGAKVTAVARKADSLAATAERAGAQALAADLSDPDHLNGLIVRAESLNGPVDVLLNNAAIAQVGLFPEQEYEGLRHHIETNLLAPMALTHQVLPSMARRGTGTVVFVSSMAGELAFPKTSLYSCSKAGLTCFAENLRRDLRHSPVKVLLAVLGEVDTTMMSAAADDAEFKAAVAKFPARALSARGVAKELVEAIEDGRQRLILPAIIRPVFALRQLPTRALDLVVSPPRLRRKRKPLGPKRIELVSRR